jgi:23S rRNA pseudouridine1911/1915/1917 synthase
MYEGGKHALSEVSVIARYDSAIYGPHALVEVTLHTGRTHQIRVHLTHIGHVIAGDELYGGSTELIGRQALHAYYIEFTHPALKERMSFHADIPDDIVNAISLLGGKRPDLHI